LTPRLIPAFLRPVAMIARSLIILTITVFLGGCSMFHHDSAAPTESATTTTTEKKGFSLWPLGHKGPADATPYLEYQRVRSESDKSSFNLFARNTHLSKTIEGDIRTTLETGPNETKVDSEHFTLAPQETKKLAVYPDNVHMTYEVSAFFKE
jgi:hypothetical protein